MIYADYDFYINEYHGTIEEEKFLGLAVKASAFLDYYTLGKAKLNADLDALKMACCALVDKVFQLECLYSSNGKAFYDAAFAGRKSESVGSYSVTYQTAEEYKSMLRLADSEKAEVAKMYLAGTNLLYRGRC